MTKNSLGRKGFVLQTAPDYSPLSRDIKVGIQGRNLGVATEAEAMVKCCLVG